ncbi:LLM class flavin-dependent oxidoreductase [Actinocrispum wychmicini]|uniref:Alkanesulfonate monooxygenase SsuD/methylene tetrahydromethanopterin reductase-like flavin-dependent oxidoreductase (Luciferase family) n=1 Tax=Actinocrispum wychmicini TaxID=1213861 RepID=A0A4R2JY78_9PSEU|nr:LLM class flavin-dependent oxidoreductase [Actinocrispum wychmicini]TCO65561.1 alkanesulfonate monooxygenase SsuD/methylene tetrahydromethanopterin reductase-like flavin-dependent oxidoreductase (luciferase family) [Actinocrispum wychmicini]
MANATVSYQPPAGAPTPTAGVLLPTTSNDPTPSALVDFAVRAEHLGYDSLWVGETLLRPVLEPLTTLAAVSTVTSRIKLGTAAMLPAFRAPVQAAQALASLDLLSGGRLIVTVGAGFPGRSETEYAWSGVPWPQRFTRLDETVALWRQLWTADEPVSFHGKVLHYDAVPPVARPHGPEIWLGGATPKALERTGRLYDGWLPYPPSPSDYTPGLEAVHAAAAAAGRDPSAITPALYATVLVTDTVAEGEAALDDFTRRNYGKPLDVVRTIQLLVAGPREHIEAELRKYVDAGARHVLLRIAALDMAAQADQLAAIAGML